MSPFFHYQNVLATPKPGLTYFRSIKITITHLVKKKEKIHEEIDSQIPPSFGDEIDICCVVWRKIDSDQWTKVDDNAAYWVECAAKVYFIFVCYRRHSHRWTHLDCGFWRSLVQIFDRVSDLPTKIPIQNIFTFEFFKDKT